MSLQAVVAVSSGLLLWRYFAPAYGRPWFGVLLAVGFFPCFSAMNMGQISFWLLAGVVGFLWAERKAWDVAAGAALALLMIKPHVTYLFWLAALWWAWTDGRRRVLLGWLAALISASALVELVYPAVFVDYLVAANNPPLYWRSATFGTWLRLLLGWELGWLQFLPSLLGGLGLLVWIRHKQGPWRWEVLTGPLLLASVVTAAYGWSYDQVVLLPAVVALVVGLWARRPLERVAILFPFVGAQLGLAAMSHWSVSDEYAIWHAAVLGVLYWWTVGGERARVETAYGECL
jgi:hypothetical protein